MGEFWRQGYPLEACGRAREVPLMCVFFAQQSVEIRSKGLWEGAFLIAQEGPSVNV